MTIRMASKTAKKSKFKKHRVGAVIVKGNRVLSTGYNELSYSKYIKQLSVHAEERAVVHLLQDNNLEALAGSTIYVSRFTKSGKLGLAAPCERCQALLRSVGIRRAIFTTDNSTTDEMMLA